MRNNYIRLRQVTSEMLGAVDVPDSFDSATNWPNCATVIDDIRDQSACGKTFVYYLNMMNESLTVHA